MKYKGYDFEVQPTSGAYIIDRWLNGSYQSFEKSMEFLQGEIDKAMTYDNYEPYREPLREERSYYSEDNRAYWDDTVPEFGRRVGG